MKKNNRKAELEGLNYEKGDFLTSVYLPQKILNGDWI